MVQSELDKSGQIVLAQWKVASSEGPLIEEPMAPATVLPELMRVALTLGFHLISRTECPKHISRIIIIT